jgi:hypothetical protein
VRRTSSAMVEGNESHSTGPLAAVVILAALEKPGEKRLLGVEAVF